MGAAETTTLLCRKSICCTVPRKKKSLNKMAFYGSFRSHKKVNNYQEGSHPENVQYLRAALSCAEQQTPPIGFMGCVLQRSLKSLMTFRTTVEKLLFRQECRWGEQREEKDGVEDKKLPGTVALKNGDNLHEFYFTCTNSCSSGNTPAHHPYYHHLPISQ